MPEANQYMMYASFKTGPIALLCLALAACQPVRAKAKPPRQAEGSATTQPATTQPVEVTTRPSKATTQPVTRKGKKEYAPHITIDWSIPQVEVDAQVVLREGPLELLLCLRGTKEHESILATEADPLRLYEALGLIGLSPGHPVRFDEGTKNFVPPDGTQLALEIEYPNAGGRVTVAAHEWMMAADSGESIAPPPWVFAGSMRIDGRFGARQEGTVVCVVDFATALIAVGALHSADNDQLWLAANPEVIPPEGTACKLLIRKLATEPLELSITPEGAFQWKNTILDPLELDAIIRRRTRHFPEQQVVLTALEGVPRMMARAAAVAIIGSGIRRDQLILDLPDEGPSPATRPASTQPASRD